jgi:broad specificity phosphatase PhoE
MTIVLVRHGQTAGNFSRTVQVPETPLNEAGLRQAELLAPRLALLGPARLLCSDLPRARMTAQPLARLSGLEVELEPLLQERNFGDWRGKPYSEFADGHPFGLDQQPPGGESWPVFHARVDQAFKAVLARRSSSGGTLIVITHGLVLHSMFDRLIDPGSLHIPASFSNTSISVIAETAPYLARLIDNTDHLGVSPGEVGAA